MTMKFGLRHGEVSLGFTEVQIRFVFDDTHYYHLVDEFLLCTHSNSFCEDV